MDRKLFTLDKNFILKEVQIKTKVVLLHELVTLVKKTYLLNYNPLGLLDNTVQSIQDCKNPHIEFLDHFYYELAGIYRFKYGENQLEFLFDGDTHYEKYERDWKRSFRKWMKDFIYYRHFIRAILEGAVLNPSPFHQHTIDVRLKLFLEQYFSLRVYKYKGIRKIQVA